MRDTTGEPRWCIRLQLWRCPEVTAGALGPMSPASATFDQRLLADINSARAGSWRRAVDSS